MKDFTKWADMWDAYNRIGEAVSGSPASICQGIGVTLMMVFGFVGLIAVAVVRRMPLLGWHMVGLACGHGCDIRWFNRDIDFRIGLEDCRIAAVSCFWAV